MRTRIDKYLSFGKKRSLELYDSLTPVVDHPLAALYLSRREVAERGDKEVFSELQSSELRLLPSHSHAWQSYYAGTDEKCQKADSVPGLKLAC
jgi:hypothetical protein